MNVIQTIPMKLSLINLLSLTFVPPLTHPFIRALHLKSVLLMAASTIPNTRERSARSVRFARWGRMGAG